MKNKTKYNKNNGNVNKHNCRKKKYHLLYHQLQTNHILQGLTSHLFWHTVLSTEMWWGIMGENEENFMPHKSYTEMQWEMCNLLQMPRKHPARSSSFH